LKILQHFAALRVRRLGAADVALVGRSVFRVALILMPLRAACTNGFHDEVAKTRSHQGFQAIPLVEIRKLLIAS